jgi:hypothetical protein
VAGGPRGQNETVNVMLLAIAVFVGAGLFSSRLGPRQHWLAVSVAILMTALYFVHPAFIT